MKIVKLTAENFKKLTAVEITPEGNVVIVAGPNGAGKTSALDSIEAALRGKDAIPQEPIRRGQEKARIVVDLDEYVITRSFTKASSYLTVTAKNGGKIASPQALLDSLVSRIAFDPMEFLRMKPVERVDMLKRIAGLDFTEIENRRKKLYEDRTIANRDAAQHAGTIAKLGARKDVPAASKPVAELTAERDRRVAHNAAIDQVDADIASARKLKEGHDRRVKELNDRWKQLEEELRETKRKYDEHFAAADDERVKIENLEKSKTAERLDVAAIDKDLSVIESRAENVAHNKKIDDAIAAKDTAEAESKRLTKALEDLDVEKNAAIMAAKFPVEGLGLDDTGVTFKGIPWDQVNTEAHTRVSVAIGLALNPKLPVILVRNGNDLDAHALGVVAGMAEAAGAQVWIERIGESGPVSVMIEGGAVVATPNQKIEPKQPKPDVKDENFDPLEF